MDQANGGTTSPKKKQVFFSIGSYSDKRVINKISTNGLFASATTDDAATIRPSQPTRTLPKTRPVSLNFLDSTPKYQTLPARHRYNDGLNVEKPVCPPSSACNSPAAVDNGPIAGKPAFPPKMVDRQLSLEPEQLRHSGRVALTIAAYEGEPRTPTRLDFLPSGRASRASSKASSSTASTPGEDVDGSRMMLQNELVATLKRSNLKKLTEDDVFQENGTTDSPQENNKSQEETKADSPQENNKSQEETKTTEVLVENVESTKELEKIEVAKEEPKSTEPISQEVSEDIKKEEPKTNEVIKEVTFKEPEDKEEIKEEIDAALTELENSTEELEIIPPPPPMPNPEKPAVKEQPKTVKIENGDAKIIPETVELPNGSSVEPSNESKDEIDVTPNGSVKQLAIELGKKMTFKADIERVPEQNGIKNE